MTSWKWYSDEEVASWPEGHKKCRGCQEVLPLSAFHKQKQTLMGVNNYCKECRKPNSKKAYMSQTVEYQLWHSAKSRAKKLNREFDIEIDDIKIPEVCPILRIKLEKNRGGKSAPNSPSLDRINPFKGYVKGNVQVISYRANTLKSNATSRELIAVAEHMEVMSYLYENLSEDENPYEGTVVR